MLVRAEGREEGAEGKKKRRDDILTCQSCREIGKEEREEERRRFGRGGEDRHEWRGY